MAAWTTHYINKEYLFLGEDVSAELNFTERAFTKSLPYYKKIIKRWKALTHL